MTRGRDAKVIGVACKLDEVEDRSLGTLRQEFANVLLEVDPDAMRRANEKGVELGAGNGGEPEPSPG